MHQSFIYTHNVLHKPHANRRVAQDRQQENGYTGQRSRKSKDSLGILVIEVQHNLVNIREKALYKLSQTSSDRKRCDR